MAPSIPQEAVELWFFVTLKSLRKCGLWITPIDLLSEIVLSLNNAEEKPTRYFTSLTFSGKRLAVKVEILVYPIRRPACLGIKFVFREVKKRLVEGWSTGTSDSTDLEDHPCFSSAKPRL